MKAIGKIAPKPTIPKLASNSNLPQFKKKVTVGHTIKGHPNVHVDMQHHEIWDPLDSVNQTSG